MKKILLSLMILIGITLTAANMPKNYRAVPMNKAQIVQNGKSKHYCKVCGMTLPMFYKTNHAAIIDGKPHQYCSIHCMIEEANAKGHKPINAKVINNDTLKFISVRDAYYVVGSSKPATMSMISKYAFGKKESAEKFAKKFGGKIMRYEQISSIVEKNLKKEIAGIKKKQAKSAKMGKKIYKKMCKPTNKRFKTAGEAKTFLKQNKLCGNLRGKKFQQVGLYLAGK